MEKIKTELKWGLVFAATTLAWMLIEKLLGWHGENIDQHRYMTNIFAIPATLVFVFALRDKKARLGGEMNWNQGFKSGMIITAFVFLVTPITLWISLNVISPEYFPNMITYATQNNFFDQKTAEEYFTFRNYVIQSALGAFMMGTLTSAIVAFFLKKKNG